MTPLDRFDHVLVTCEHGGNRVPARYAPLFAGRGRDVLATHRGWDPGALTVARKLADGLGAPLHFATVSRLVVDLNRSAHHPRVFSDFTRGLSPEEKARICARYYQPHRDAVERRIAAWVARRKTVLHLAVHSFTPVLDGEVRNAELGLLYDPKRPIEQRLCGELQHALGSCAPALRVRRNYPYVGYSDGFTTYLRRLFGPRAYAGVEIEINQSEARTPARLDRARRALEDALRLALTIVVMVAFAAGCKGGDKTKPASTSEAAHTSGAGASGAGREAEASALAFGPWSVEDTSAFLARCLRSPAERGGMTDAEARSYCICAGQLLSEGRDWADVKSLFDTAGLEAVAGKERASLARCAARALAEGSDVAAARQRNGLWTNRQIDFETQACAGAARGTEGDTSSIEALKRCRCVAEAVARAIDYATYAAAIGSERDQAVQDAEAACGGGEAP